MLDKEIWIGLLSLTAILYLCRWWQSNHKVKVYRISADSLKRSKEVMLKVLPLVESEEEGPLDAESLPYPKDSIKSAAKILAYFYWKGEQLEELGRVKNCFLSLARFQADSLDPKTRQRRILNEQKSLARELDHYMSHYPFQVKKSQSVSE